MGVSRRTNANARRYLFEDRRGKDGIPSDEISFFVALGQQVHPNEIDASVRAKDVRSKLVDIPKALAILRPEPQLITGILHTDQEMSDWVTKELAKAKHKGPPFGPCLVATLDAFPCLPQSADHLTALASWVAQSKQGTLAFLPQEVSLQFFRLYHLLFLIASALFRASDSFGGLSAKLSHLGTALSLAITEHIGIALSYHRAAIRQLQERARQRLAGAHFTRSFSMS